MKIHTSKEAMLTTEVVVLTEMVRAQNKRIEELEASAQPPLEMTPEMMRKVQMHSELGAYAAANLSGAYELFQEFWRVSMSAAPQPAQQEPEDLTIAYMAGLHRGKDLAPQRTWVGLTDEDKHYFNEVLNLQGRFPVIDAIEAKCKEKNNG